MGRFNFIHRLHRKFYFVMHSGVLIINNLPDATKESINMRLPRLYQVNKVATLVQTRSKKVNFAVLTNMGLTGFDSGQKRFVSMPGFGLLARKS